MSKRRWASRAIAFVVLLGGLVAVASSPASATASQDCQTRTYTDSSYPGPWYWNTTVLAWRWGYYQVSYCRHGIRWDPQGYAFEGRGNVNVRVRFVNSALHTTGVSAWVTAYGSGSTVTVAGFVPPGTWFAMECRAIHPAYPPGPPHVDHCLGQIEF